MLNQLHSFTAEEWKLVESQFSNSYKSTVSFVSENKGSLNEARDIYVEAFIYYTQLLELHGMDLLERAEQIIYSFGRKLWLQKLEKKRVDINFVKHRREFYEMEDAFHEIASINERSAKTATKLAEVGEPARTLINEHIGNRRELGDVASRLGMKDETRAFSTLAKYIRKLVRLIEGKEFEQTDEAFERLLRYVLDNPTDVSERCPESDKVCITMIARTVAMVRNYSTRNERIGRLRQMQARVLPDHLDIDALSDEPLNKKKMKPALVFGFSAFIAVSISAITAFGILNKSVVSEVEINSDTPKEIQMETNPLAEDEREVFHPKTAFVIDETGFLVTSSEGLSVGEKVFLNNGEHTALHARVLAINEQNKIAIVQCDSINEVYLPYRFAPEDARVGESLFALGYTNHQFFYEQSHLNANNSEGYGRMKLQIDLPGAPVLCERGQIIGMITDTQKESGGISKMMKVSALREIVNFELEKHDLNASYTRRNKLFYDDRTAQIENTSPFVYEVNILKENNETIMAAIP
ncbi:MAG TPA: S1C family serine protease [Cryomorphaceae bacterium]|nr:S1C family serine protease [Cryomorphaceae bacterium]